MKVDRTLIVLAIRVKEVMNAILNIRLKILTSIKVVLHMQTIRMTTIMITKTIMMTMKVMTIITMKTTTLATATCVTATTTVSRALNLQQSTKTCMECTCTCLQTPWAAWQ